MKFGILILSIALFLSVVAGYFSIIGLAALFAASAIPVIIMASGLEAAKVGSALWLHRHWHEAPLMIKSYLLAAVLVLMLISSIGIFGFLSKAHLEQEAPIAGQNLQIELIDQQIAQAQDRISRANSRIEREEQSLDELNGIIKTLEEYDKISGPDGSRAVRASQQQERKSIAARIIEQEKIINEQLMIVDELTLTKTERTIKVSAVEAKLGPLRYIMELLGQNDTGEAVRLMILLIMFAFDPVAILMALAGQWSILRHLEEKKERKEILPALKTNEAEPELTEDENIDVSDNNHNDDIQSHAIDNNSKKNETEFPKENEIIEQIVETKEEIKEEIKEEAPPPAKSENIGSKPFTPPADYVKKKIGDQIDDPFAEKPKAPILSWIGDNVETLKHKEDKKGTE